MPGSQYNSAVLGSNSVKQVPSKKAWLRPAHATSDGAGETREAQHAIRGVCEEDIGFCEVMQLRAFRTTSKTFLWTAVLQD